MTALTPPPERDVPPAVRGRVLDALDAAPRRRWVPLAAAAAAVVALAVPAVVLTRDATAPVPATPAVPSLAPWTPPTGPLPGRMPGADEIVSRCLGAFRPEDQRRPERRALWSVRAVHLDAVGWAAWIGGPDGATSACAYTWAGAPNQVGAGSDGGSPPRWAPASGTGLLPSPFGGGGDGRGGLELILVGTVAPDVSRVELRWGDLAVRAAVRGPFFVARVHGERADVQSDLVATAYRADGTAYEPALLVAGEAPRAQPGGPALGDGMPAEDLLLRRCLWDANRNGPWSRGVTIRSVFRDARGYVAYVGGPGRESVCAYRYGGAVDLTIGTIEHGDDRSRDGYATHPRGLDAMDSRGGLLPGTDDAHQVFFGTVNRGVTRVTVSVDGGTPVEAAVRGPFYAARVIYPAPGGDVRMRAVLDAYDADGNRVGRTTVQG